MALMCLLAGNAAARPQPGDNDAEAMVLFNRLADCVVARDPVLSARWAGGIDPPNRPFYLVLSGCGRAVTDGRGMQADHYAMRGIIGMAFVRQPEKVPAGLAALPLARVADASLTVVNRVADCIVADDPAAARAFAGALPGQREERAAFAALRDLAGRCIDEGGVAVNIDPRTLRAGLGIALLRRALRAPPAAGG